MNNIIQSAKQADGSLFLVGFEPEYKLIDWGIGSPDIFLEGYFTAQEVLAIAQYVESLQEQG